MAANKGVMKTESVTVEDTLGNKQEAVKVICPNCHGDTFSLFVLGQTHNHLLCVKCNTSYCQGGGACNDIFCETK